MTLFYPLEEAVSTLMFTQYHVGAPVCADIVPGAGNTKMHKTPALTLRNSHFMEKDAYISTNTQIYHGKCLWKCVPVLWEGAEGVANFA